MLERVYSGFGAKWEHVDFCGGSSISSHRRRDSPCKWVLSQCAPPFQHPRCPIPKWARRLS